MRTSPTVLYRAKEGKQIPERFEGGELDVLMVSLSGGEPEQIGLKRAMTQTNEEAVEINPIL